MNNNIVYALYDDDDILLTSVKKMKEKKLNVKEVYTPFPVHGLDKVLELLLYMDVLGLLLALF